MQWSLLYISSLWEWFSNYAAPPAALHGVGEATCLRLVVRGEHYLRNIRYGSRYCDVGNDCKLWSLLTSPLCNTEVITVGTGTLGVTHLHSLVTLVLTTPGIFASRTGVSGNFTKLKLYRGLVCGVFFWNWQMVDRGSWRDLIFKEEWGLWYCIVWESEEVGDLWYRLIISWHQIRKYLISEPRHSMSKLWDEKLYWRNFNLDWVLRGKKYGEKKHSIWWIKLLCELCNHRSDAVRS